MFQTKVFIALGSNIGDKISNIKQSIHEIKKYGKVVNYGDIYISKPYGFKNQQNFFILPIFSNSLTAQRKLNIALPRFEPSAIIVSV